MADNSKNMNPNGLPPDSDLLLSYLKREMSNAEKHELEKRMLGDDFLADAAEGLTAVNNPLIIADITAQINAKVNTPEAKTSTPKRSPLAVVGNTMAIAASVILLVVAAWFISQSVGNKKPISVADTGSKQDKNANAPITEQLKQEPIEGMATDTNLTDEPATPAKPDFTKAVRNYRYETTTDSDVEGNEVAPVYYETPALEDVPVTNSTTATGAANPKLDYSTTPNNNFSMYDKYGPASNSNNAGYYKTPILEKSKDGKKRTKIANDSISDTWGNRTALSQEESPGEYLNGILIKREREDDSFKSKDEDKPAKSVSEANVVTGSTKNVTVSPANKALNRGLEKYNKGDYRSAINDLEDALKADPNNHKAQYSLAMAYKNTNRPDNAITRFSKIPANSPYYENAQWETANIYLNKNEDAKCIAILKTIVKLNGAYKIRAQNMINNLEEQLPKK